MMDFQNDWKLITVFFSAENPCSSCASTEPVSFSWGGLAVKAGGWDAFSNSALLWTKGLASSGMLEWFYPVMQAPGTQCVLYF